MGDTDSKASAALFGKICRMGKVLPNRAGGAARPAPPSHPCYPELSRSLDVGSQSQVEEHTETEIGFDLDTALEVMMMCLWRTF